MLEFYKRFHAESCTSEVLIVDDGRVVEHHYSTVEQRGMMFPFVGQLFSHDLLGFVRVRHMPSDYSEHAFRTRWYYKGEPQ